MMVQGLSIFFQSLSNSSGRAFPYEEPTFTQVLVLLSFIYFLNVTRSLFDSAFNAGLLAQIALGMIYGTPLASILPPGWEATFTAMGYLGLIGIIFEGGLYSNPSHILSGISLSVTCAVIGVLLPIAFSMALLFGAFGYAPLEAFAAGAALCSTSLGTTLMVLRSINVASKSTLKEKGPVSVNETEATASPTDSSATDLGQARLTMVLVNAAMIDDVIGLVLSSVIQSLGNSRTQTGSKLAWTIVKPLLSSSLIAGITPLAAYYILRPILSSRSIRTHALKFGTTINAVLKTYARFTIQHNDPTVHNLNLCLMVLALAGMSSIAYFTGSSALFGAYLAGILLNYFFEIYNSESRESESTESLPTIHDTFEKYIQPLQQHILAPLFFSSIGFAVPFLSLWNRKIVWRGMLYALLMGIGKIAAGVPVGIRTAWMHHSSDFDSPPQINFTSPTELQEITASGVLAEGIPTHRLGSRNSTSAVQNEVAPTIRRRQFNQLRKFWENLKSIETRISTCFVGTAMVSRGEIGLLIAQLGRTTGSSSSVPLLGDEAFLVCIWAIILCTLVGPISMGFIVKRWGVVIVNWR
ncbi:hypothetical protein C8Q75DRAFT_743522 [Abortiporus biennis]|nr:hypothetical protein C8Q75DRAFT_743522 [Abortiporus biennis]